MESVNPIAVNIPVKTVAEVEAAETAPKSI